MAVSKGDVVDSATYKNLVERVAAVLGNGEGQNGYGQRVFSAEDYWSSTDDTIEIGITEWNSLRGDINKARNHQTNNDTSAELLESNKIIGADASGVSVTRISGDDFSIDTPETSKGINDYITEVSNVESNAGTINAFQATTTTGGAFGNSTRTDSWGTSSNQSVYCELAVEFQGGYNVTAPILSSGGAVIGYETVQATGADHRRHFFNAGGEIRLSAFLNGSTAKDTDWGTMLGNAGTIRFLKNQTTLTGTGRARDGLTDVDGLGGIDSAIGNYQLTTGYQLIFMKNGSQAEYAENYVQIYAKRNTAGNRITFQFEFNDVDAGDQTGIGPGVDEPVLAAGGSMGAQIDLKRPTGDCAVPEPVFDVVVELRLT